MTLVDYCANCLVKGYAMSRYGMKFDLTGVKLLLQFFPDRFLSYRDTVAIFLRLSDVSFASLKRGELDLKNPKVLIPLFKEDGDNIHIIGVVSSSVRDMLFLCRYLKQKSLSWYTPDMSRLVCFERS